MHKIILVHNTAILKYAHKCDVVYSLTEFGKTLIPSIKLIKDWGEAYITKQLSAENYSEEIQDIVE
ncbi:winged helix-turn-helix transcriptional regulator [Paenibacillus lentus]|uniref:winged helix-turn-helix transcriptional regulator n=1 Tax=Paenibacillus lentus TaxID=1338368 RepID=UPI00364B10A0